MTLRALVVDDEPVARRRLKTLLEGEKARSDRRVRNRRAGHRGDRAAPSRRRVPRCSDARDSTASTSSTRSSQADIRTIVFVTAYDRYAVRAFDVHAVDYLLKPFERGRLRKALERLAARSDTREAGRRIHAAVDSGPGAATVTASADQGVGPHLRRAGGRHRLPPGRGALSRAAHGSDDASRSGHDRLHGEPGSIRRDLYGSTVL